VVVFGSALALASGSTKYYFFDIALYTYTKVEQIISIYSI